MLGCIVLLCFFSLMQRNSKNYYQANLFFLVLIRNKKPDSALGVPVGLAYLVKDGYNLQEF